MPENKYRVPMSSPDINQHDQDAVLEVLGTRYLSIGPKLAQFENAFRSLTGAKNALGVSSGTSGLHLCIRAADIQPGDYVITTPFSFVSSTNVILFEKAIPVFVDVDPKTGNINPELVKAAAEDLASGKEDRITRWLPRKSASGKGKLKAILPVDVFGQPADYDALTAIAASQKIALIEDSCEALGAEYKGKKAGMLGDMGVFAFYPNKQMTTGEGGMIVTNDDRAADFMKSLRNQGRAPGDTWLQHTYLGYNYRLDELSAALGLSQIKRVETLLENRQAVADMYNTRLGDIKDIEIPYISPATTRKSWFVYVIRVSMGINRDEFAAALEKEGIPVRPYFSPIHLQPYMIDQFGYRAGDFPVTEDLGNRSLALPFSGVMSEDEVNLVCNSIEKSLNQ